VEEDDEGSEQDLSEMMREWDRRGLSHSGEATAAAAAAAAVMEATVATPEAAAVAAGTDNPLSPLCVERSYELSLGRRSHSLHVERPATATVGAPKGILVASRIAEEGSTSTHEHPASSSSRVAFQQPWSPAVYDRQPSRPKSAANLPPPRAPTLAPPPPPKAPPARPTSTFGAWGPPPPRASSAKTYLPTVRRFLKLS